MNTLTFHIDPGSQITLAHEVELDVKRELAALTHRLNRLENRMSEYDDVLAKLATALTSVATRIQGYMDKITSLSGTDIVAAKTAAAELQPFVDHLNALAADPVNPGPVPDPVTPVATGGTTPTSPPPV